MNLAHELWALFPRLVLVSHRSNWASTLVYNLDSEWKLRWSDSSLAQFHILQLLRVVVELLLSGLQNFVDLCSMSWYQQVCKQLFLSQRISSERGRYLPDLVQLFFWNSEWVRVEVTDPWHYHWELLHDQWLLVHLWIDCRQPWVSFQVSGYCPCRIFWSFGSLWSVWPLHCALGQVLHNYLPRCSKWWCMCPCCSLPWIVILR